MALADPNSLFLTDLARKRAQAQSFAQSGTSAANGIVAALGDAQKNQQAQTQQATENALRLRQVQDSETQQEAERRQANDTANQNAMRLRMESDNAANTQANEGIRLKIEQGDASRREQTAQAVLDEKARTQQLSRVGAMASDYVKGEGPLGEKNLEEFSGQLVGQPGFEQLKPEDVQHAYEAQRDDEKSRRLATDVHAMPSSLDYDMDAIAKRTGADPAEVRAAVEARRAELAKAAEPEAQRKNAVELERMRAGSAANVEAMRAKSATDVEAMRAAAERSKGDTKGPNPQVIEAQQQKRALMEEADGLISDLRDPSKDIDLSKVYRNQLARQKVEHGGIVASGLGAAQLALEPLNDDENKASAALSMLMERGTGAVGGGHRVLAEKGKAQMQQTLVGGTFDNEKAATALEQMRDALRNDYAETNAALPKEGAAMQSSEMIPVRLKDGRTGRVPMSSYDPATMERL